MHYKKRTPADAVTPRELEAIEKLARGLTAREIARELGISYDSVRGLMYDARQKVGVDNGVALAIWYVEKYRWAEDVAELRQSVADLAIENAQLKRQVRRMEKERAA